VARAKILKLRTRSFRIFAESTLSRLLMTTYVQLPAKAKKATEKEEEEKEEGRHS